MKQKNVPLKLQNLKNVDWRKKEIRWCLIPILLSYPINQPVSVQGIVVIRNFYRIFYPFYVLYRYAGQELSLQIKKEIFILFMFFTAMKSSQMIKFRF